jgi:hypothetical protein
METYYRIQSADRDAAELLNPTHWVSRIWSDQPAEVTCPDCVDGRVHVECPSWCDCGYPHHESYETCHGRGYLHEYERAGGVSCCRTLGELYAYFRGRDADLDGAVVVKLEGEVAEVEDFDAEHGAVLVRPTRIVDVGPLNEWDHVYQLAE